MTHALKTWPEFYKAILDHSKPFELRKNDRPFKVGDKLLLQEWDPVQGIWTGNESTFIVTYILEDPKFGLEEGYCIMGIKDDYNE